MNSFCLSVSSGVVNLGLLHGRPSSSGVGVAVGVTLGVSTGSFVGSFVGVATGETEVLFASRVFPFSFAVPPHADREHTIITKINIAAILRLKCFMKILLSRGSLSPFEPSNRFRFAAFYSINDADGKYNKNPSFS